MRVWLMILSFLCFAARADDDFGYILYAHKPTKVGSVLFSQDDAILVRPKLAEIKLKGKADFTAVVDFKRINLGEPQSDWQRGRMDFSKWRRPQPLSQEDPNTWTTEPAHAPMKASLPKGICPSGDKGCKGIAQIIYEFHNSDLCDQINRTATLVDSRTIQLLKAWNDFIAQKSKGRCHVGPPGKNRECEKLKRARDVDILTRTAVFESEQLNGKTQKAIAKHECEQNVIMLAIRNTAYDKRCRKIRRRKMLHGCAYPGDITGAATKPEEINIWLPDAAFATRITGCFLRADAEEAEWKQSETMKNPDNSRKAFLGRRKDYISVLERAYSITNPKEKMENWFDIEMDGQNLTDDDKRRLVNSTKLYYHPTGMAKCDPKTYDKTVYVGTGFVKKDKTSYLLSGTRLLPASAIKKKKPVKIGSIYTAELRGDRYGKDELWDQYFKALAGGSIDARFVDRDRNNTCWPSETSSCKVDDHLNYRKAPLWAVTANNEKYRFSCRSRSNPSEKIWVWNGSCDPAMVIAPPKVPGSFLRLQRVNSRSK
jgi:hypothetical protein